MRKIYSILLAVLLLPALAMAADNMAISKTLRTSATTKSDSRAYVDPSILKPVAQGEADFAYTLGAWINVSGYLNQSGTSPANNMVLLGYGGREHCNDNGCWNLCLNASGNFNITGWGAQGAAGTISGTTVSTGEWHHVAVAYDPEALTMTVFLDGNTVATKSLNGKHEWFTSENPAIYFAAYGFGGLFDEAQIWNKALTEEELAVAMVSANRVDGLVGLYTFDENNGTAGTFANQSTQDCAADNVMYFENVTGSGAWANGLVYVISQGTYTTEDPTFAEGRVVSYDVTLTVPAEVEGGSLVVTVNGTAVEAGANVIKNTDEVVVTATPNAGWDLVSIYAGEKEITSGVAFTLDADAEISATFSNVAYALALVNACELPYTLTNAAGDEVDLAAVAPGTTLRLVLTVPDTHILNAVRLGDTELTLTRGYYEFTMPEEDATLTIDARAKAQYTVTIDQPEEGVVTVSANGTELTSGASILEGTELTLAATANEGYAFVNFIVDGNAVSDNTLTPQADVTISALFEEGIEYCVPTPVAGRANGSTTNRTDRGITSIAVTDGTNSVTIAGGGTTSGRDVYIDRTNQTLVTEAGKTITLTVTGSGEWMNTFIYADFDKNGFQTSDKVYNNYTGANNNVAGTFSFTVPADQAAGLYRVRYKLDWEDQDPCIYGQTSDNGDAVIDFMIEIPSQTLDAPRTIKVSAADEAYGTAEITTPKNGGNELTTDEKNVVLTATPAEGLSFKNWTRNGEVVSNDNPYTYSGEEDAEFVANFGYVVNFQIANGGKLELAANGTVIGNGSIVEPGAEMTATVTAPAGKEIVMTVNGQPVALEGNVYTFTLESAIEGNIEFVDKVVHYYQIVTGNGSVECWSDVVDVDSDDSPAGFKYENGSVISDPDATLNLYFMPGEGAAIASAIVSYGEDAHELTYESTPDVYYYGDPINEDLFNAGVKVWWTQDALTDDFTVTVVFSDEAQGIEEIGLDAANGPVEYYNLQGIRVAAENLTSGFYVVRQGDKAVKVFIAK